MGAGAVEDLVDMLVAANRIAATAQARVLELVLQVVNAAPDPRFGVDEVAFALSWTQRAAATQESLARQLIHGLPDVFAALANGRIDLPKARVFADVLQTLDPEVAQQIAAQVLPVAGEKTTAQLRDRLHRRALAADPEHARKRRDRAHTERRVILQPEADGTATLTALGLPPTRAAAAFSRITAIAKARKAGGATDSMDQLRADALLDLLEGVHAPAGRGVINLTVGLETLARLNEQPALVGGYGPVAADIARQWANANPGYQWRAQIINLGTGDLLWQGITRARPGAPAHGGTKAQSDSATQDTAKSPPDRAAPGTTKSPPGRAKQGTTKVPPVPAAQGRMKARPDRATQGNTPPERAAPGSTRLGRVLRRKGITQARPCPPAQDPRARFANAAMARWIRARDKTCRAPGCRVPAERCDLDHTVRHADGGPTSHDDLAPLCGRHHPMKDEGGWQLHQPKPGHFIWISPLGRIYHVGPEPP